jgi:hypothetical protein
MCGVGVQYMAENLFRVEADSDYATASLPEPPCEDLGCDLFGRAILIIAGTCLLACIACVVYNNVGFYLLERKPRLPHVLRVCSSHVLSLLMLLSFPFPFQINVIVQAAASNAWIVIVLLGLTLNLFVGYTPHQLHQTVSNNRANA